LATDFLVLDLATDFFVLDFVKAFVTVFVFADFLVAGEERRLTIYVKKRFLIVGRDLKKQQIQKKQHLRTLFNNLNRFSIQDKMYQIQYIVFVNKQQQRYSGRKRKKRHRMPIFKSFPQRIIKKDKNPSQQQSTTR
jgi:hypothetical protein